MFAFIKLLPFAATLMFAATGAHSATVPTDNPDFLSIDQILATPTNNTECATGVFSRALAAYANGVDEDAYSSELESWARGVFAMPDVLRDVLNCPEVKNTADTETITFLPIHYKFSGGRELTINYATQPKVLKQRLDLATRRRLPTNNAPNPAINGLTDDAVWTNTDPAWYAIMVVESGTLRDFVGPDKNNTISIQYINDHIDDFYPRGFTCTDRSALANDNFAINRAVTKTVGLEDAGQEDSNDYYVAGDINLEWIFYAEVAIDVIITVATFGGGAVALGATKAARASKVLKSLSTTLRGLMKLDTVRDYIRVSAQYARAAEELAKINRTTDAAAFAAKSREIEQLAARMRSLEQIEDVKKYRDAAAAYSELNAYRHSLRGLRAIKAARRGNVATRLWRALRAANTGEKALNRGAKLARSSMKSGRIRDMLFHSTMRNAGRVARLEETGGLLYGIWKFGLDMWDYTDDSTDLYTSGLEFKPLLLLSADDIDGSENVVNYGMWLLWAGDSLSAADDDAAYLQAMDFAAKFHQDLMEIQNDTASPCSVDIYVVRPIIRNPGGDDAALYYLIMNDTPWTTAETN